MSDEEYLAIVDNALKGTNWGKSWNTARLISQREGESPRILDRKAIRQQLRNVEIMEGDLIRYNGPPVPNPSVVADSSPLAVSEPVNHIEEKEPRCFFCNKTGHKKMNCPKWKSRKGKKTPQKKKDEEDKESENRKRKAPEDTCESKRKCFICGGEH